MPQPAVKYRPDIDGLRAIAVLGVLLFHIDKNLLSGGFVGVDVFFVISGFLITSVIDRDCGNGNFSFLHFYERRIRRIIPALFVVIVVAWAIAMKTLLPEDLINFSKSVRYTLFSASNFHFLNQSEDYFQEGVAQMPLLHTWSLGVEEQFYILFPILMVMGHRWIKSRNRLITIFAVLSVMSFFASQWIVRRNPEDAFYMLPWRAWEMLIGSLLAMIGFSVGRKWLDHLLGGMGLAMIVGSMIAYSEATIFPGFSAAVPCLGTALVIFAGRSGAGLASRILSWKPVVGIGLISYSVYLWHWPLIAFAKYTFLYHKAAAVGVIAASLILGWLSWYFVERPFRKSGFMSRKAVYISWIAASVLLLGWGSYIDHRHGFPSRFSDKVLNFLKSGEVPKEYIPMSMVNYSPSLATVFGDRSETPTIALWGDSHAGALLPVLDALGKEHHKAFRSYDMPSQPPMTGVTRMKFSMAKQRAAYSEGALAAMIADPQISKVILHARWASYSRDLSLDKGPPALLGLSFKTVETQRNYVVSRLNDAVDQLLKAGKQVIIVYPMPEIEAGIPDYLAKLAAAEEDVPEEIDCDRYDDYNREMIEALDVWKNTPNIITIHPEHLMMRNNNRLRIRSGDELLFRDNDHLSVAGALFLRDLFDSVFKDSTALPPPR